jgi:hypothetical protein
VVAVVVSKVMNIVMVEAAMVLVMVMVLVIVTQVLVFMVVVMVVAVRAAVPVAIYLLVIVPVVRLVPMALDVVDWLAIASGICGLSELKFGLFFLQIVDKFAVGDVTIGYISPVCVAVKPVIDRLRLLVNRRFWLRFVVCRRRWLV